MNVGVLRRAKMELLQAGWCQGVYWESADGACCILGAALRVSGLDPDSSPLDKVLDVENYVERALRDVLDNLVLDIDRWNDEDGRTEQEVLAALDRAIAYRAGVEELP